MTRDELAESLGRWARQTLALGGEHCLDVHARIRIPGAGIVDLLSVRHVAPPGSGPLDHFSVGLWSIVPGAVDDRMVDAMIRRVYAFEAWYSELLENAETHGFSPRHRIRVCGNVVGRSIRRSPFVEMLSNWGSAVCFWTWVKSADGIEAYPHYGKGPALAPARAQLKGLLHHLPWQDGNERSEETPAETQRTAPPPVLGSSRSGPPDA